MDLDSFIDFLDNNNIPYKTTFQSIILSGCPNCGPAKEKIYLFKDRRDDIGPFFGQCMKCSTSINSKTYLYELGLDRRAIDDLHGRVLDEDIRSIVMPHLDLKEKFSRTDKNEKTDIEPEEVDTSMFFSILDHPKHEASLYAKKRGWTEAQANCVFIDYYVSAVVFVVNNNGKTVGYQRRMLHPFDPNMKTISSTGFQKRRFILEFPNDGDICVCEGPFTALSAWHYGFHAVCTFGSNVGEKQLDAISMLSRTKNKSVAVAFDEDSSGRKGHHKIKSRLFWDDTPYYRIKPEAGNDLNDSWMSGKKYEVVSNEDEWHWMPSLYQMPFKSFF
jgi:hypothetical protein